MPTTDDILKDLLQEMKDVRSEIKSMRMEQARTQIALAGHIEMKLKGESMTYSIAHELPAQPYVNGTWDDADVMAAVENYLKTISHD